MNARPLRRSGRVMPPILWDWTEAADPDVLREAARLGGNWLCVSEAPSAPVNVPGIEIVLGIPADALQARRGGVVHERLRALGVARCAAVMLREISPGGVKAGGPFHRLSQLRDQGAVDLFFAEADDYAAAEWLLHHTPAHAIAVGFSLHDMTVKYRLLADAVGFGTGVIARPGMAAAWSVPEPTDAAMNISFLSGEEGVTAILLPVPRTIDELGALVDAVNRPMPEAQRADWWVRFREQVGEPAPPPRGVAPDIG